MCGKTGSKTSLPSPALAHPWCHRWGKQRALLHAAAGASNPLLRALAMALHSSRTHLGPCRHAPGPCREHGWPLWVPHYRPQQGPAAAPCPCPWELPLPLHNEEQAPFQPASGPNACFASHPQWQLHHNHAQASPLPHEFANAVISHVCSGEADSGHKSPALPSLGWEPAGSAGPACSTPARCTCLCCNCSGPEA